MDLAVPTDPATAAATEMERYCNSSEDDLEIDSKHTIM